MNSRRDFLKLVGIGATVGLMGAGNGVLRYPLPSEDNYVSKPTVGRPVEGKAAVYDRTNHISWSEPTFIKKCGEFKTGDLLFNIENRTIKVTVPCSMCALYSYVAEKFDEYICMGIPCAIIPITRESYMFRAGWRLKDEASLKNIRNGGFEYIGPGMPEYQDYTAYSKDEYVYMGVHTMGAVRFDQQLYYRTNNDARGRGLQPFHSTGAVNEVIKVRRDMKWLEIECNHRGYHHVFDEPVEPMCYRFPFQTESWS